MITTLQVTIFLIASHMNSGTHFVEVNYQLP